MLKLLLLCCIVVVVAGGPPVVKSRSQIEEFKSILEKTKEGDGLTLDERMKANPHQNVWESSGKFQGDILLHDDQIEDMVEEFSSGRMATTRPNSRWPSATVVYEFGQGEFNLDQQRYILLVMDALSTRTCVRFRPRTASDRVFVRITGNPDGCYAHVGYSANFPIHNINLARDAPGWGCLNYVVIAHEWYHILGFYHMQSTYNRDSYVRINWQNVMQGYEHAFDRFIDTTNLGLPYEYGSCMHYGAYTFSRNGQPTISTIWQYDGVLGQTSYISGWDIMRLQRHYNCPGAWSSEALQKARTTVLIENGQGEIVDQEIDPAQYNKLEYINQENYE